jgi:hypothetical protein
MMRCPYVGPARSFGPEPSIRGGMGSKPMVSALRATSTNRAAAEPPVTDVLPDWNRDVSKLSFSYRFRTVSAALLRAPRGTHQRNRAIAIHRLD